MVSRWVVFCEIVRKVCFSRPPVYSKLALGFAVMQPVVVHIHRFCSFGLDFVVYYSLRHQVVVLDRSSWLWMTHFREYYSIVYHFFYI
jgi:hypothetical protein